MNKTLIILVILLIPLINIQAAHADTISIYPEEDTYIDSSHPDDNFVGDYSLYTRKSLYSYISDETGIGLLKFDLSKIPQDSIIISAKLRLRSSIVSSPTSHIAVYKYSNDDWDPATVTWDNFPAGSDEYLSESAVPYADKYYFWNVLSAVKNKTLSLKLESTIMDLLSGIFRLRILWEATTRSELRVRQIHHIMT